MRGLQRGKSRQSKIQEQRSDGEGGIRKRTLKKNAEQITGKGTKEGKSAMLTNL